MKRNEPRHNLVLHLLKTVIDRGSGRNQTTTEFYKPSERFFIGNLSPVPEEGNLERVKTKLSPTSIGLEFQISHILGQDAKVILEPSGAFYYRIYPTYEQQLRFHDRSRDLSSGPGRGPSAQEVVLAPVFKKIRLENVKLEVPLAKLVEPGIRGSEIVLELTNECKKLWELVKVDKRYFRSLIVQRARQRRRVDAIPAAAMDSEEAYESHLRKANKSEMELSWNLTISRKVFETRDGYRIVVRLENSAMRDRDYSRENSFFESCLRVTLVNATFQPFTLEYLEESYEHKRTILASGINCSCTEIDNRQIETEHVPRFEEPRFSPIELPDLTFTKLIAEPSSVLAEVQQTLEQSKLGFAAHYSKNLEPAARLTFERELNSIEQEIERFRQGSRTIIAYQDAMRAFKLTNETFRLATSRYGTWRLFQIVFIVSLIPDLLCVFHPEIKNLRERVDLLFYPTGGGKTEAFLGLAVFQAFLDRINGKRAGVLTIAKFPLRMLSLQQLQRIADIFAKAELVRRRQPDISREDNDPFGVGYYVGENNTPNELVDYDTNQRRYVTSRLDAWQSDHEQAQKFLVIANCPFCGEPGKVRADSKNVRLYHWCDNPECESHGPLPIYISDTEIYRYLPTLVVSTLDKMVIPGFQRKFRNILGGAFLKCPLHGYSSSWKCTEGICGIPEKDLSLVQLTDPFPSLLIQDELHLVRETLGCFASHYETFFNYAICSISGEARKKIKVIGATATASNYEQQIEHLYLMKPIRFPTNIRLYLHASERIARVIVGIMPHAKTVINSLEEIVFAINSEHQVIARGTAADLSARFAGERVDENAFRELCEDFETQVSYHGKKIDAEQLGRSVWSRINHWLESQQLDPIVHRNLTGDVSFHRVRRIMGEIEGHGQPIGLVTATSLISHGIDIDKLNLMVFMGMPGNNAEYIQALSRVARKEEGLVVVLFNPIRERDQSYYRYFLKFHELSHMLIEGVPINRWAPSALERTSSGIFTAAILSYFDLLTTRNSRKGLSKVGDFKRALAEQRITEEEIKAFVRASYGIDQLGPAARDFVGRLLDERIASYISSILNFDGDQNTMIFQVVQPEPLRSLRSVESAVGISLDAKTQNILRNFRVNVDSTEV